MRRQQQHCESFACARMERARIQQLTHTLCSQKRAPDIVFVLPMLPRVGSAGIAPCAAWEGTSDASKTLKQRFHTRSKGLTAR